MYPVQKNKLRKKTNCYECKTLYEQVTQFNEKLTECLVIGYGEDLEKEIHIMFTSTGPKIPRSKNHMKEKLRRKKPKNFNNKNQNF